VLDENGKRVRNVNAGSESGERRVRDNDGRGGRGLGRGSDGSGGVGGGKMDPILVNASITSAVCPQDILTVVRDNLLVLNHVNVSTAFNKLGKMGSQRDFFPRHLTVDKGFQELLGLAQGLAETKHFGSQALANTTHGIAKLHEAGRLDAADRSVDDALAALETDTVRVAPTMSPQAVANVMLAYAKLERMPDDKTWVALETAAGRVAPEMNPQAVANLMWAFSKLKRMPDDKTWAVLNTAAGRVAREMNPQAVGNVMLAYAKLERTPDDMTWAVLETAAGRVAPEMNPQAVANVMLAYAKLERTPDDKTWAALETAARRVAREMNPQNVGNVMWAYAKLERMPDDKTWAALETAVGRMAREMNPQAVANVMLAYAKLERMPDDKTWAALETAAARVAPEMNPQSVGNVMLAHAKLKRMPNDMTWAVLETAARQVAPEMNPQNVGNVMGAFSKLERMPDDKTWAALETAAGRVAPEMNAQNVGNVMGAFSKLERMPDDKTWAALETAVGRVAREMNPQNVANTMLAYATLGRVPDDKAWTALETTAERVARDMNSQNLANALWASATLFTLRDVKHPPCYAAMWDLVCGFKASDFSDRGLCMLFHVHLMHFFSSSSGSVKVAHPAWLMVDARDAWMQQVRDDTTVSKPHRALASVIGVVDALGIRHEVERVTGDGYFSMDIYLPEHDVAVEFDGPSHYYHSSASLRDASKMLRTAKTELRNWLLAKQCAKVVTVPWFEWRDTGRAPEKRRAYMREKPAVDGLYLALMQCAPVKKVKETERFTFGGAHDQRMSGLMGAGKSAREMSAQDVSRTLFAFGKLSETCRVNEAQVLKANNEISRVASAMTVHDVGNVFWAWRQLAKSGVKLSCLLGTAGWKAAMLRLGDLDKEMTPSQKDAIEADLDLIDAASSSTGVEGGR
jgi:hypothetical protein